MHRPDEVDALVISTCTGYLCPGLTSYVSERLGCRADVLNLDLVGQGCVAAMPNLCASEALLAAGFIFTVHFFNTHFRLEKFPMDTVIFSGRISKTELLHERRRWYERLLAGGRLNDLRSKDEWERWKGPAGFDYLRHGHPPGALSWNRARFVRKRATNEEPLALPGATLSSWPND